MRLRETTFKSVFPAGAAPCAAPLALRTVSALSQSVSVTVSGVQLQDTVEWSRKRVRRPEAVEWSCTRSKNPFEPTIRIDMH